MTETKEVPKCAWCGRTGDMKFASTRLPNRYFCNDSCLHKFERFNRNSQNWLKVKEKTNG